mgnify:CR=1 FL=1
MKNEKVINNRIRKLTRKIENDPGDMTALLRERAGLWEQLGDLGEALNDLRKILEKNPEDISTKNRIQYLQMILRFNNMDIFSDTNTNHDPWME